MNDYRLRWGGQVAGHFNNGEMSVSLENMDREFKLKAQDFTDQLCTNPGSMCVKIYGPKPEEEVVKVITIKNAIGA